jgi:FAD:protein FMN transferase
LSAVATESFRALGTRAAIFITESAGIERARTILQRELEEIDLACSRFRADSELAEVNRAGGRPVRVSALFLEAITVALSVAEATDGAVDPTVGRALRAIGYDRDFDQIGSSSGGLERIRATLTLGWRTVSVDRVGSSVQVPSGVELDLGATAKALSSDRAAKRVHAELGGGVLVNLGGDLSIAGDPPAGGWLVRVADDHAAGPSEPGQTVCLRAGGLATSSTTVRRWQDGSGTSHHIVDPRTGESAREVWRTVSVAAASCVDANAASTAAIVRGETAPAWLSERRLPSRLVRASGEVVSLCDWPGADST